MRFVEAYNPLMAPSSFTNFIASFHSRQDNCPSLTVTLREQERTVPKRVDVSSESMESGCFVPAQAVRLRSYNEVPHGPVAVPLAFLSPVCVSRDCSFFFTFTTKAFNGNVDHDKRSFWFVWLK